MGFLICPNGVEPVIHQDNWPVILPVDRHSTTPTFGSIATHPFIASLLLLSFCLLSTMDSNNSDDNQDTRMWSSRIEIKLINMLREKVQKIQTKGCSTMWTIRRWNHFATELQNPYGFQYTPK
ncbi:hypothetical protein CsSME_00029305 [Camellia sinensis var. sinensis]